MFCGVWIRGTKSQYFPGSNFPRAKPFRTKRQAQKGRNCCSPDSVIIFLELIESTYSLLKTCSACIFKKKLIQFWKCSENFETNWNHPENYETVRLESLRSSGNIPTVLSYEIIWKYSSSSETVTNVLKVSGNVQKPTGKDEVILKYWDVWKICKPSRNISFETVQRVLRPSGNIPNYLQIPMLWSHIRLLV